MLDPTLKWVPTPNETLKEKGRLITRQRNRHQSPRPVSPRDERQEPSPERSRRDGLPQRERRKPRLAPMSCRRSTWPNRAPWR
jgi:hypothetical protein